MAKDFVEVRTFGHDIVTALGVVTIRANELDVLLGHFLTAVSFPDEKKLRLGKALIYSTRSAKARSDMIRAAIGVSDYSQARKAFALMLIDRVDKLSDKRNGKLPYFAVLNSTASMWLGGCRCRVRKVGCFVWWKQFKSSMDKLADEYEKLRIDIWNFYNDVVLRPEVQKSGSDVPWRGTPD